MTAEVPGFGARREAREDALALLYEAEIAGGCVTDALARRPVPPSDYAVELVHGFDADHEAVDTLLRAHLVGWRLERLAIVDRTLARIAVWELLRQHDIPTGVVLSEAVALASQYCSAESPRFLNGVLSAVAREVRDPQPEQAGETQ